MRSWQHTVAFLAFALVAGVVAFAGQHYHAASAPHGDARLAAADK
jgi:hypothetical protein